MPITKKATPVKRTAPEKKEEEEEDGLKGQKKNKLKPHYAAASLGGAKRKTTTQKGKNFLPFACGKEQETWTESNRLGKWGKEKN